MFRKIDVFSVSNGSPRDVSYHAAMAIGSPRDRETGALRVSGCGMDMGFHVAYALSATLYRDGFGCIGEGCPSNDHSNGDRDYTPHMDTAARAASADGTPCACHADHWHREGGYALRHRWL
jgi:hypothetical protein